MRTTSYLTAGSVSAAGAGLLAALAVLLLSGCTEPLTVYHVPNSQSYVAEGKKILVMPFMDTRTFVTKDDAHKADLGYHARNIFVQSMQEYGAGSGMTVLTPMIPQPRKSLTNAEVAEIGRQYGADIVVSGQVFSFTDTRAASIPPRAGMFVRLISADDGSLLFVGDHYQAATLPVGGGGREQQARNVANRLVEGFLAKAKPAVMTAGRIASGGAYAMLSPIPVRIRTANKAERVGTRDNDQRPAPSPFPGVTGGSALDGDDWEEQLVPEVPPLIDFGEDFYSMSPPVAVEPVTVSYPEPSGADVGVGDASSEIGADEMADESASDESPAPAASPEVVAETEAEAEIDAGAAQTADGTDPAVETAGTVDADSRTDAEGDAQTAVAATEENAARSPFMEESRTSESAPAIASETAPVTGTIISGREQPAVAESAATMSVDTAAAEIIDELPEIDFSRIDPNMVSADAPEASRVAAKLSGDELASDLFAEDTVLIEEAALSPRPSMAPSPETADAVVAPPRNAAVAASEYDADEGRVVSTPLAIEQPRTIKTVEQEHKEDPEAAKQGAAALVATPNRGNSGGVRVLILPYHDRPNRNNLIENTGGGEVVTTLFGIQMALDSDVTLMWDASGQATHDRLISREDALMMGRQAGADYVMRGQVIEFRRAQSVPSFYSAVISTAVLAAQMFFAEMSGVDVATEVYRVSDGLCVMSRRDRSQQKYVVQAEKTVRRMAAGMADGVGEAIRDARPETMDPLIDELMSEGAVSLARY